MYENQKCTRTNSVRELLDTGERKPILGIGMKAFARRTLAPVTVLATLLGLAWPAAAWTGTDAGRCAPDVSAPRSCCVPPEASAPENDCAGRPCCRLTRPAPKNPAVTTSGPASPSLPSVRHPGMGEQPPARWTVPVAVPPRARSAPLFLLFAALLI